VGGSASWPDRTWLLLRDTWCGVVAERVHDSLHTASNRQSQHWSGTAHGRSIFLKRLPHGGRMSLASASVRSNCARATSCSHLRRVATFSQSVRPCGPRDRGGSSRGLWRHAAPQSEVGVSPRACMDPDILAAHRTWLPRTVRTLHAAMRADTAFGGAEPELLHIEGGRTARQAHIKRLLVQSGADMRKTELRLVAKFRDVVGYRSRATAWHSPPRSRESCSATPTHRGDAADRDYLPRVTSACC
jgi:hypothetical protein